MDPTEESSLASLPCPHCGELHPTSFSHCPRTGRPTSAGRALVGRVIAKRYRVLALIGEGGMGAVYVAEHLSLGRKVALKRLRPDLASDEQAVRRFQREARAAAATGHEHIVEVIDLGFGEDGAPFLVMEYVRGKSLAQLLREEKQLDPRRACRIVGQVLTALEAVHARGIVHRDLKPDNVILTQRELDPEFVKVVDFGISKFQTEEDGALTLTRTGVTLGTPHYMSPEQARGMKELDHRVDLYGAGVLLYECLGGRRPYEAENYHQLLGAILSGNRPRLADLRPELPAELVAIVERAIAVDRDARHPSATALLQDLEPHGASDPPPDAVPPLVRPTVPTGAKASPSRFGAPHTSALTVREPLAPYPPPARTPPKVEPLGSMNTPSERGDEPTRVKGSLVSAALHALSPRELDLVLGRLDDELAAKLRGVILPMAWVPLSVYLELLGAAEEELGDDVVVRIGEVTADRDLPTMHRSFMKTATPDSAVERIPLIFRAYHGPGRAIVHRESGSSARVEVAGLSPDTFLHARALSGFYRRLLERAGAGLVRASVVSYRERGDDATITHLRWR